MPLSISNSDERIPPCEYGKLWAYAVSMWIVLSLTVECAYRVKGYSPSVNDTKLLWAYWRSKVYSSSGRKSIVILGNSRALLGIVPKIIGDELPGYEVIHLAVAGKGCIAALRDLADDEKFNGIVICSIEPTTLMDTKLSEQQPYVEHFRSQRLSLNTTLNLHTILRLQTTLCVMSPYNSVRHVIQDRLLERARSEKHLITQFNRYRAGYFRTRMSKSEFKAMQERHRFPAPASDQISAGEFTAAIEEHLVHLCDKMVAKNGIVIFVRMPQSGEHWKANARRYPKELYWDEIASRCAAPAIHFADYPELSKFECPEGEHLDYEDALEFTKNLCGIVRAKIGRPGTANR